MHFSLISALFSTALALSAATGNSAFHWSGKVPSGQFIEIRGINGSIHAEPASGENVEVIAYKARPDYDSSGLEVKVLERDGGVTICAVYASLDGQGNECLAGPGARGNGDVEVEFTVRVPKGVRFVGRTVNGRVEARSLDGDTEAHTVNGNLLLSTAGTAQGDTVNGSIEASVGRITSGMRFSTVNGGITLDVPARTGARINANTLNGRILTNFPLPLRSRYIGMRAEGPIGGGGPELRLATVNGSIKVRRARRNF